MKLNKTDYQKKIAVATPLQLVVINYELIIYFLEQAKNNLQDSCKFNKNIDLAYDFLRELVCSLDSSQTLSSDLFDIYFYINRLVSANKSRANLEQINEAISLLAILSNAFMSIKDKENSGVEPAIFAGLTYNKDGELDEYFESANIKDYRA